MINWNKLLSNKRLKSYFNPDYEIYKSHEFDNRNDFEGDLGRLVFSPPVRRMHDKTQVFPLLLDDNTHTRLTHSLEVSTVSYSLGITLMRNEKFNKYFDEFEDPFIIPMIFSTVGLAHDVGNPPFGHVGEKIIAHYFSEEFNKGNYSELTKEEKADFTMYNGNAQGFRTLTKLNPLNEIYGLNLTIGTLATFLKYPISSDEINERLSYKYRRKLGVFQSEVDYIKAIRKETEIPKACRHPLAFFPEAADTICYRVMDLEDGFNNNLYKIDEIIDWFVANKIQEFCPEFGSLIKELNKMEGIHSKVTKIVSLRLFLIKKLIIDTCNAYLTNADKIFDFKFRNELLDESRLCKLLDKFFDEMILAKYHRLNSLELTGKKVLEGLLNHLINGFNNLNHREKYYDLISTLFKRTICLEKNINTFNIDKIDTYDKLRLIVDYISGMTDSYALRTYRHLEGIEIA